MAVRACNDNWEWIWGRGKQDYATESMEVYQDLKMKIQSWMRDCFFDSDAYIDWEKHLSTKALPEDITSDIVAITVAHTGVRTLNDVSVDYDSENRYYTITIAYTDIYGNERVVNINE